jgi:hypothetical protein
LWALKKLLLQSRIQPSLAGAGNFEAEPGQDFCYRFIIHGQDLATRGYQVGVAPASLYVWLAVKQSQG